MHPISAQLEELISAAQAFRSLVADVEIAGHKLATLLGQGGKILTCGNGGSAADALHFSEELVCRFDRNRRALPAVCLCADAVLLTCLSNDLGYEVVFSRQIEGLARAGDALVVFSSSGNSPNLIQALSTAKAMRLTTLSVLGKGGGRCAGLADHELTVPSATTARVQELHTFILHCWMSLIEADLGLAT